ncbi:MAG: hypothetical protein KF819_38020 [Labilithrix sp.]|nr:hypothetical protein [Labilithrix sp.]
MRIHFGLGLAACLLALGCPLGGQSKGARAQEAALELNLNARFGRMELAAERVAPKARDSFFDRRRTWGGNVRIADYELAGLRMTGDADCETVVKVAWYRANEGDLRLTTVKQSWHDFKGDWKLTEEMRSDGDVGLFGEPLPAPEPGAPARRTQFPTIRLGSGASLGAEAPSAPIDPPTEP